MVNALFRHLPKVMAQDNVNDLLSFANCAISRDLPPLALSEFIKASVDLPTIEELAKKSKKLAIVLGVID